MGAAPQIGWGLRARAASALCAPCALSKSTQEESVAKGRAFVLRTGGKGVYFLLILPSPCDLSKPCVALRGGPEQQRLPPSCPALQRGAPSPAAAWCWGTAAWQQRACPVVLVLLQGSGPNPSAPPPALHAAPRSSSSTLLPQGHIFGRVFKAAPLVSRAPCQHQLIAAAADSGGTAERKQPQSGHGTFPK